MSFRDRYKNFNERRQHVRHARKEENSPHYDDMGFWAGLSRGFGRDMDTYKAIFALAKSDEEKRKALAKIEADERLRPKIDSYKQAHGFGENLSHTLDLIGEFIGGNATDAAGIALGAFGGAAGEEAVAGEIAAKKGAKGVLKKALEKSMSSSISDGAIKGMRKATVGLAVLHGMGESAKDDQRHGKNASIGNALWKGAAQGVASHFLFNMFQAPAFKALEDPSRSILSKSWNNALNFGAYSVGMEAENSANRALQGRSEGLGPETMNVLKSGVMGGIMGGVLTGGGLGLEKLYHHYRGTPARTTAEPTTSETPPASETPPPTETPPPPRRRISLRNNTDDFVGPRQPRTNNSPDEGMVGPPKPSSPARETDNPDFVGPRQPRTNNSPDEGMVGPPKPSSSAPTERERPTAPERPPPSRPISPQPEEPAPSRSSSPQPEQPQRVSTPSGEINPRISKGDANRRTARIPENERDIVTKSDLSKSEKRRAADQAVKKIKDPYIRQNIAKNLDNASALAETNITRSSGKRAIGRAYRKARLNEVLSKGTFTKENASLYGKLAEDIRSEFEKVRANKNKRTVYDDPLSSRNIEDSSRLVRKELVRGEEPTRVPRPEPVAKAEPIPDRILNKPKDTDVTSRKLKNKHKSFTERERTPGKIAEQDRITPRGKIYNKTSERATAEEITHLNRQRGDVKKVEYPIVKNTDGKFESVGPEKLTNSTQVKKPIKFKLKNKLDSNAEIPELVNRLNKISDGLEKLGYVNPREAAIHETLNNPNINVENKNRMLSNAVEYYPSETYSENTLKAGGYRKNQSSQLFEKKRQPSTIRSDSARSGGEAFVQGEGEGVSPQEGNRGRESRGNAQIRNEPGTASEVRQEQGEQSQQRRQGRQGAQTENGSSTERALAKRSKNISKSLSKDFTKLSEAEKKELGLTSNDGYEKQLFNKIKKIFSARGRSAQTKEIRTQKAAINEALKNIITDTNNVSLVEGIQIAINRFENAKYTARDTQAVPVANRVFATIRERDLNNAFRSIKETAKNADPTIVTSIQRQADNSPKIHDLDYATQEYKDHIYDLGETQNPVDSLENDMNNVYNDASHYSENETFVDQSSMVDADGNPVEDPAIYNSMSYVDPNLTTRHHFKSEAVKDTYETDRTYKANTARTTSEDLVKAHVKYLETAAPTLKYKVISEKVYKYDENHEPIYNLKDKHKYKTEYYVQTELKPFNSKTEAYDHAKFLSQQYLTDEFFVTTLEDASKKTGFSNTSIDFHIETNTPTGKWAIIRKEQPRAIALEEYTREQLKVIKALSDKSIESFTSGKTGMQFKIQSIETDPSAYSTHQRASEAILDLKKNIKELDKKRKELVVKFNDNGAVKEYYIPNIVDFGRYLENKYGVPKENKTTRSAFLQGMAALEVNRITPLKPLGGSSFLDRNLTKTIEATEDSPGYKELISNQHTFKKVFDFLDKYNINITKSDGVPTNRSKFIRETKDKPALVGTLLHLHEKFMDIKRHTSATAKRMERRGLPAETIEARKKLRNLKGNMSRQASGRAEVKSRLEKNKQTYTKRMQRDTAEKRGLKNERDTLIKTLNPEAQKTLKAMSELKEEMLDLRAKVKPLLNKTAAEKKNFFETASKEEKSNLLRKTAKARRQLREKELLFERHKTALEKDMQSKKRNLNATPENYERKMSEHRQAIANYEKIISDIEKDPTRANKIRPKRQRQHKQREILIQRQKEIGEIRIRNLNRERSGLFREKGALNKIIKETLETNRLSPETKRAEIERHNLKVDDVNRRLRANKEKKDNLIAQSKQSPPLPTSAELEIDRLRKLKVEKEKELSFLHDAVNYDKIKTKNKEIDKLNSSIFDSDLGLAINKEQTKEFIRSAKDRSMAVEGLEARSSNFGLGTSLEHATHDLDFFKYLYKIAIKDPDFYRFKPRTLFENGEPIAYAKGAEPEFQSPGKRKVESIMEIANMEFQEKVYAEKVKNVRSRGREKGLSEQEISELISEVKRPKDNPYLVELRNMREKEILDRTGGWARDLGEQSEMVRSEGLANDNPYSPDAETLIEREYDLAGSSTIPSTRELKKTILNPLNRNRNLTILSDGFSIDEAKIYHDIANKFNIGKKVTVLTKSDYQNLLHNKRFENAHPIYDFKNGAYIGLENESFIVLSDLISGSTSERLNRTYAFMHEFGHAIQKPLQDFLNKRLEKKEGIYHRDIENMQNDYAKIQDILKKSDLGKSVEKLNDPNIRTDEFKATSEDIANYVATDLYLKYANRVIPEAEGKTLESRMKLSLNLLAKRFRNVMRKSESTSDFIRQSTSGRRYNKYIPKELKNLTVHDNPLYMATEEAPAQPRRNATPEEERRYFKKKLERSVGTLYSSMDTTLRSIDPDLANMLTSRTDGPHAPANEFRKADTTNLSYDLMVSKNSALASNALMKTKYRGKSLNDSYEKAFGVLSPNKRLKEQFKADEAKTIKQLLKGENPTKDIGKTFEGALRRVNDMYKSKNNPEINSTFKRQLEPNLNYDRIESNKKAVAKEFEKAMNRVLDKSLTKAKNEGKMTRQTVARLKAKGREINAQNAVNHIDGFSDSAKAKERFKSTELPQRKEFIDTDRNSLLADSALVDFLVDNQYVDTNLMTTAQNHIQKYVKGNAIAEKFSGYETINRNATDRESIKKITKAYSNNILGTSEKHFSNLVKYSVDERKGVLSPDDLSKKDFSLLALGDKMGTWLDLESKLLKEDGTFNTKALIDKLAEKGYIRDTDNNPLTNGEIPDFVSIYSPNINLENILGKIEKKEGTDVRNQALRIVKGITMKRPTTMGKTLKTATSVGLATNNMLSLAFTAFSSIPETMGVATKVGSAADMFKAVGSTFKHTFNMFKKTERQKAIQDAINIGLITESHFKSTAGRMLDTTALQKGSSNAMNHLFHLNGQEAIVKYQQAVNLQIGKELINTLAKRASALEGAEKADAIKRLERYGLTHEDVTAWDGVIKNGFDLAESTASDAKARLKMQDALFRIVDEAVVRTAPGLKPYWSTYPGMAFFWNLKSYMYAHFNRVIAPFYRDIKRLYSDGFKSFKEQNPNSGIMKFLISKDLGKAALETSLRSSMLALMYMPLAWVGLQLRQMIQYSLFGQKKPTEKNTLSQNMFEAAERSSLFGSIGSMSHHAITSKSPAVEKIAGMASPIAGRITRLFRPDSEKLASFSGAENAASVNRKMKIMSMIPIVSQLPGLKMKVAQDTTRNAQNRNKIRSGLQKTRDIGNYYKTFNEDVARYKAAKARNPNSQETYVYHQIVLNKMKGLSEGKRLDVQHIGGGALAIRPLS